MSNQPRSIKELIITASQAFDAVSDSAKLDAELLLCEVLERDRTYLFTWSDKILTEDEINRFYHLVEQRIAGHPIAHILGYRDFWDLTLKVSPATLIPRPDTEILVEKVLDVIAADGPTVGKGLDLGTGTGAIALALASELPNWQWRGVDLIDEAVTLAQENALKNNITNCHFSQSSWFTNLSGKQFDFIVSNPPYIDPLDPHLNQGDVRFEPRSALVAQESGLADIKHIAKLAPNYLTANGKLIFEHGYDQGQAVRNILTAENFQKVETFKDLGGNDRVSIGYFR